MKITCDARALLGALDLCASVAPAKTTMPVLHQALLYASADGTVTVTATDLTVQVRVTTPAEVMQPGSILIPVCYVAEWLDEVDDFGAPVELELRDNRLDWSCGPYCMRTLLFGGDELPIMVMGDHSEQLPRVSTAAVHSVAPALMTVAHSRDDRVHVNTECSIVSFYAFGRDQAVLAPLRSDESGFDGDWCIPARVMALLKIADGVFRIAVDDRRMRFSAPNLDVVTLFDRTIPPAPQIMDLVEERFGEDDFRVGRRELSRLLAAGLLLKTPAHLSYQARERQLAVRGERNGEDETHAAVDVVEPPAHEAAVIVDCLSLQRMLREIPGDPVGINIGNAVLGGPGVRLWPYQDLPDGALLLYGLRGTALTERKEAAAA